MPTTRSLSEVAAEGLGRQALDNGRGDLYASLRVLALLFNVVSPIGWAQDRPRIVIATLLLVVVDLGVAFAMRRYRRGFLRFRIPYDFLVVSMAAAIVPLQWPYSGVLLLMVPTALELTAIKGLPLAAAYICMADCLIYITRRTVGGQTFVFELVFYGLWMLAAAGAVFWLLERNGYGLRKQFLAERQAFTAMVTLDSWNKLLLGLGGVMTEALNRAWQALELATGEKARKERIRFREAQVLLAERTRGSALYLRDLILQIGAEQRRNRAAVSDHLHLTIDRADGLRVVTPTQAEVFAEKVRQLGLTGKHAVVLEKVDHVTGELGVRISSSAIIVPPSSTRAVRLVLLATIFGNLALLALANPIYAAIPVGRVLLGFAASLLIGVWADWLWRRGSGLGSRLLLVSSLAPGVTALVLSTSGEVHWRLADGRLIAPAIIGVTSSLYITGAIYRFLGSFARFATVGSYVGIVSLALLSNPYGVPSVRTIMGELMIPASVLLAVFSFERRNQGLGESLHEELTQRFRAQEQQLRLICFEQFKAKLSDEFRHIQNIRSTSDLPEVVARKIADDLGEAEACMVALEKLDLARAWT